MSVPSTVAAAILSLSPASADTAPTVTEERTPWDDDGFYFVLGAAPGSTFHIDGFNPLVRYDAELGMRWTRRKTALSVGAQPWILQRLEARGAGGGLHGVVTLQQGPFYVRSGLGVVAGIPGSPDDRDSRAAMSFLAGVGLESQGDEVRGRIGFDYAASYDKAGRMNGTVFLTLAIRFG